MREPQVATGKMTYRSPDYLKWEYFTPNVIAWEIDGDKCSANPQIVRLLRMILSSVSGSALQTNDEFDVRQEGNIYTLVPKKREWKRMFKMLQITMNEQTSVAEKVEMTEANNDKTMIVFSNVKIK
jgi:hypothetical protein